VLRHDFQPGKLVLGVFLTGAAVAFEGDARGLWHVPWFAMVPIMVGGLCLAAIAGTIAYAVRRRRGGANPGGTRPHGPGDHGSGSSHSGGRGPYAHDSGT
jgi:hypothetical protein